MQYLAQVITRIGKPKSGVYPSVVVWRRGVQVTYTHSVPQPVFGGTASPVPGVHMHGKDHLDTYLLRVLYTLLTEQSVTRTAVKLGQSQPAISNTLKRLREITGDAILVRGKNGMVPTERGHELLTLAQQSLEAMERIARPSQEFDPGNTTRTFHLGAPDYLDAFFLPNIVERLRKHAPQAKLVVHPLNAGVDYLAALEQGGMDLVIGNWLSPPEHLHISPLFDDEVVCMLGAQHPWRARASRSSTMSRCRISPRLRMRRCSAA